jgi:hypothetical protein
VCTTVVLLKFACLIRHDDNTKRKNKNLTYYVGARAFPL